MNEFKLKFYFTLYKDRALPNRQKFRYNFKKHHGKFKYIEELIIMIERYQIKKYGTTLGCDTLYISKEYRKRLIANERNRKRMQKARLRSKGEIK